MAWQEAWIFKGACPICLAPFNELLHAPVPQDVKSAVATHDASKVVPDDAVEGVTEAACDALPPLATDPTLVGARSSSVSLGRTGDKPEGVD